MKTLLIGYGNATRSDDGVGILVVEDLEAMALKEVEIRTYQQLHVEILEDFGRYQRIVLVDVCPEAKTAEIVPVGRLASGMASSHHLSAELLLSLARATGYPVPEFYVCRVPGHDFSFGNRLSESAREGAEIAKQKLRKFLAPQETVYA